MPQKDHSVFDEPQFFEKPFVADPADIPSSEINHKLPVGQGAWDEPALSLDLAGERPSHVETYAQWLTAKVASFSWAKSWGFSLVIALGSGLWAVAGAMLGQVQSGSMFGLLVIVVFAPLAEEMLKASAALITIEKWPYVFRSPAQIILCCMAAALGFSVLENLLYLKLYIPDPTATIIWWRWTVCVLLHTSCSTIVSLGLVRIWRQTMTSGTAPRVSLGTPYIITAATVHGIYNFIAIIANPLFAQV